jgi:hypothetical protein
MRKIICYGIEQGKLWFGYVTLKSLIASYFRNGRSLEVKPIKGFENYAYYKDCLMVDWDGGHKFYRFTNWWANYSSPFAAIAYSEGVTNEAIQSLPSIH